MFKGKKVLPFILPPIIGFLIFYIIPFIGGLYYCFFDQITGKFIYMKGFKALVNNKAFVLAVSNTFKIIAIFVPLIIFISLLLSYFIFTQIKKRKKFASVLQNVVIIPYLMPSVALVYSFSTLFENGGIISNLLNLAGLDKISILNSGYVIIAAGIIYIWKYCGINILILVFAMISIPAEIVEAARADGAGESVILKKIIIPSIYPEIYFVIILSLINSFKLFREIYILVGSYPPSSLYMFQHFINNNLLKFEYTKVVCAAYIIMFFISLLIAVMLRIEKKYL